jgi:acetyl esterase/lipase
VTFDPSGPHPVVHEDVEYARPDGEPLLARVYRPEPRSDTPLAALVDVHGGAWTYFDRTADAYFNRALAACGMVVVALDFRQAPQHRYPTAVSDVIAGITWTKANARTLGIRADGVGLIGGSSGGHLLMLAALRPNAPEYNSTPVRGAQGIDARTAYALPLWPILDPSAHYHYLLERRDGPAGRDPFFQPERLIGAHDAFFGDEATMETASALRFVERRECDYLPPIWLAHPELDENVTLPMSLRFVAAYRATGGQAELEVFPGVGHAFANLPGPAADACIVHMRAFIARQLAALG